jgi:hypothetical protein
MIVITVEPVYKGPAKKRACQQERFSRIQIFCAIHLPHMLDLSRRERQPVSKSGGQPCSHRERPLSYCIYSALRPTICPSWSARATDGRRVGPAHIQGLHQQSLISRTPYCNMTMRYSIRTSTQAGRTRTSMLPGACCWLPSRGRCARLSEALRWPLGLPLDEAAAHLAEQHRGSRGRGTAGRVVSAFRVRLCAVGRFFLVSSCCRMHGMSGVFNDFVSIAWVIRGWRVVVNLLDRVLVGR